MKKAWAFAAAACAALAAMAIWTGSLNQDEGWYLYAANLVSQGKMPYRDFFYTQGPLLPLVYSRFAWIWESWGLLGARAFNMAVGLCGVAAFSVLAGMLAPEDRRGEARLAAFAFLGCNLYHLYFNAIPKTYALGGLFVATGFCFYCRGVRTRGAWWMAAAGFSLALAAGARISLGALLAVAGVWLLATCRRNGPAFLWFGIGGAAALALVYGPFIADPEAFKGLCAAQAYHAARGGFSPLFTAGSVSRLVRWYAPVFFFGALLVRRLDAKTATVLAGFAAVVLVQLLAPFPYEDYNVPVMGLAAAAVASRISSPDHRNAAILLAFACAFGSPLLEKWTTNGQDRFWTLKKETCELSQLRDAARKIEAIDPGGKTLLTQDLYLAIETGRSVPEGLEMGPFSILDDSEWRHLLSTCDCPVAALSGYTFAIEPPSCAERPTEKQIEYWSILRDRYDLVQTIDAFGQNATALLILKKKGTAE